LVADDHDAGDHHPFVTSDGAALSRKGRRSGSEGRRWCFADQLGPHFVDHIDQRVLLIESRAAFERRRFHRRKAHLVLSALRHRAAELGDQALLLQTRTYREALDQVRDDITVCRPTSWPPTGSCVLNRRSLCCRDADSPPMKRHSLIGRSPSAVCCWRISSATRAGDSTC
jgi:hypothetical protein